MSEPFSDLHRSAHTSETEKPETWSLVDFIVSRDECDIVSDALWMRGVVAIEERDIDDSFVALRTSMGDDPSSLIQEITDTFQHVSTDVVHVPRSVADTWRQFATHTKVNDQVTLVPAWLRAPPSTHALYIEPLDTFGLGNHPTTVLALRLALQHVPESCEVFDLGSGSGVLAVGLAKFRNSTVTAYDIADSAREALVLNASLNDVSTVQWREGIHGTSSDCVVANILAPVLIAEANAICDTVRQGGVVILSGMRSEQVDGVVQHFEKFSVIDSDSLDGWTAVVLQRSN